MTNLLVYHSDVAAQTDPSSSHHLPNCLAGCIISRHGDPPSEGIAAARPPFRAERIKVSVILSWTLVRRLFDAASEQLGGIPHPRADHLLRSETNKGFLNEPVA